LGRRAEVDVVMPGSEDPSLPGAPLSAQEAQERYENLGGRTQYSGEVKGELEQALHDAVDGSSLTAKKRFEQGKSFCHGMIQILFFKFPKNLELKKDLLRIREDLKKIKAPKPTYAFGISQGARVLEIRGDSPEGVGDVHTPHESMGPLIAERIEEESYEGILDDLLDIVWELAAIGSDHKVIDWQMQENVVEDDIGDQIEEEEAAEGKDEGDEEFETESEAEEPEEGEPPEDDAS
jgi:hypothetical protein